MYTHTDPSHNNFFDKRNQKSFNLIRKTIDIPEKRHSQINGNHNRSSQKMQMNFNNDLYMNQQLPHFDRQKLVNMFSRNARIDYIEPNASTKTPQKQLFYGQRVDHGKPTGVRKRIKRDDFVGTVYKDVTDHLDR